MAEDIKCVAGCIHFTGHEAHHHKDCPYYQDSFSKRFDDLYNDSVELLKQKDKKNKKLEEQIQIMDLVCRRQDTVKNGLCKICRDKIRRK
jgi:hypothetical protein